MSIKIFCAFRAPLSRMNEVIDFFHDHMWKHVVAEYKSMVDAVKPEEAQKRYKCSDGWAEYYRHNVVIELFEVIKRTGRPIHSLECGLSMWVYNDYIHIQPYGPEHYYYDLRKSSRELTEECPVWLEEYHYQNQINSHLDQDDREYQERGAIWKRLTLGEGKEGCHARRITHIVFLCDPDYWGDLSFDDTLGNGAMSAIRRACKADDTHQETISTL